MCFRFAFLWKVIGLDGFQTGVGYGALLCGPYHSRAFEMSNDTLLLRAAEAARLCAVSKVSWFRWDSAGRIPQGLKIGGCKVWRRSELEAWIEAGTPNREKWQALQAATRRGGR